MPKEYFGPKVTNWFYEEMVKCSVCGMWNDPKTTPSGGRHHAASEVLSVDSTTGRTFYDLGSNDAGQGCAACGSPAWRTGGKAGDLKREW